MTSNMALTSVWKGHLCHKNKTIAEVSAMGARDCPIEIPKQLDVHQKVKFEEFTEKVVKKSSEKLSFCNIVNQEEHFLQIIVFTPTNEKSILSSFMTFLVKTQSVGVSVLGENESVMFLVPSGLTTGDMFPSIPDEITKDIGSSVLFGVIKISKMTLTTTDVGRALLEELQPDVKPPKVGLFSNIAAQCQNAMQIEIKSEKTNTEPMEQNSIVTPAKNNDLPDSLSENATEPGKNLTRLSVYMSNLPLPDRKDENSNDKNISNGGFKPPKKKLSLKDYKKRQENLGNQSPEETTGLPDLVAENEMAIDDNNVIETAKNNSNDPDVNTNTTIEESASIPELPSGNSQESTSTTENNDSNLPKPIVQIENAEEPDVSMSTLCKSNVSNKSDYNTENDHVHSNQHIIGPINEQSVSTPNSITNNSSQIITEKYTAPNMVIKSEKHDAQYEKALVSNNDNGKSHPQELVPVKKEPHTESSESDDGMDELPDLGAASDSEMDTVQNKNNPGDSISFKTNEIVMFKPKIYSSILDDLDKLKLYLGDTAKLNLTAHREKCMQLIDTVGDRLIGNRTRKKLVLRSVGHVTEVVDAKPKILVTSEMQTDDNIVSAEDHADNLINKEVKEIEVDGISDTDVPGKDLSDVGHETSGKEVVSHKGKKRQHRKSSKTDQYNNNDESELNRDTEGYFTMLLKLNGAFDDTNTVKKRSQSKTVKTTVSTTSYRVATKTSYNIPPEEGKRIEPETADDDRSGQCTPEIGATPSEGNNVLQYVDGRLRFQPNNSQLMPNNTTVSASNFTRNGNENMIDAQVVNTNQSLNDQAIGKEQQAQSNYDLSWRGDSNLGPNLYRGDGSSTAENDHGNPIHIPKPVNHSHRVYNTNTFDGNILNGNDSSTSSNNVQTPSYSALQPPFHSNSTQSEGSTQNQYQDVDLRNESNYGHHEATYGALEIYPYNSGVFNQSLASIPQPPVPPSAVGYVNGNTPLTGMPEGLYPTSTMDTTFYTTNSSVEVIQDVNVLDKEMETDMIDILEILHEGTAAEQASLKKPKGRSKRARKKRRAIAEAEKLFSLVMLAQKIESQQKLSVLSEKQKKREFYKRIINTYANKGPETKEPKDEETMIMECVEQLMGEGDTKEDTATEKTDTSTEKRKSTDHMDFNFDDYEGLSDKKKKKYDDGDDEDCKIVEHVKKEREDYSRKNKRPWLPPSPKMSNRRFGGRVYSKERAPWYNHRDFSKVKSRKAFPSRSERDIFPEDKKHMFDEWPDVRYINHLFITANKITYGTSSSKPWKLKVKSCVQSISDRKTIINKRLDRVRHQLASKGKLSFKEREHLTAEKSDYLKNLRSLDLLASLYNFYYCKFVILETLQQTSTDKQSNPENYKEILSRLCDKLDFEVDNLRLSRKELDIHKRDVKHESDRRLLRKAYAEVVDMIENIKTETKKYREQI